MRNDDPLSVNSQSAQPGNPSAGLVIGHDAWNEFADGDDFKF